MLEKIELNKSYYSRNNYKVWVSGFSRNGTNCNQKLVHYQNVGPTEDFPELSCWTLPEQLFRLWFTERPKETINRFTKLGVKVGYRSIADNSKRLLFVYYVEDLDGTPVIVGSIEARDFVRVVSLHSPLALVWDMISDGLVPYDEKLIQRMVNSPTGEGFNRTDLLSVVLFSSELIPDKNIHTTSGILLGRRITPYDELPDDIKSSFDELTKLPDVKLLEQEIRSGKFLLPMAQLKHCQNYIEFLKQQA